MTDVLVVADELPWPPTAGGRLRLRVVLRGLLAVGDVRLVAVLRSPGQEGEPAPDLPLVQTAVTTSERRGRRPVLRWSASGLPRAVAFRDWSRAQAEVLEQVRRHPPVLTWFHHSEVFLALGHLVPGVRVVDVDNLEGPLLRQLVRAREAEPSAGAVAGLRRRLRSAVDRRDARRWDEQLARVDRAAEALVLCSGRDVRRAGLRRAVVVPNGYEPAGPVPLDVAGAPPAMLVVASLDYPPNLDGLRWFCDDVLPRVLERVPAARLLVVGRASWGQDEELARRPGVEVLGPLPDVGAAMARAAAVVVPLRSGGGTRLKVLEALAHGLPVVSTAVGCEGIDVVPGRDVLVADDPAALADACVGVLTDPARRAGLGAAGHEVWRSRYRSADVSALVTALAARLLAERDGPAESTAS